MTNEFDAMTQGVSVGGVRSRYGVRVLLCYILKNVDSMVSRTAFSEILQSTELVNFFEINPALDALYENGLAELIEKEDDDYFRITPDGISVADKLQTDIPLSAREQALSAAFSVVARERLKGTVDYNIDKTENGCYVTLTVKDGGEIMMQTKLFAADYLQAELVGENFMKNPDKLYSGIIDSLTL
ncbi:MAG: DUF4364 family protein [Ruminococcaceae bacterium]|nr:DUF4364 family protein [Oscillospiraceae bacterium]MBR3597299.1 DUF4364 family protein [Clostridia bacterium]